MTKHSSILRLLWPVVLFVALLSYLGVGWSAEPEPVRPLGERVKDWQKTLDATEKELAKPDISDRRLAALRDQLMTIPLDARTASDEALPEVQAIRDELAALGPPPGEGAPPEAPTVAAKRKAMNERLAAAEGAIKEAELIIARAGRLVSEVKTLRRTRFTEHILKRGISPLSPTVWRKAWSELGSGFTVVAQNLQKWRASDTFAHDAWAIGWRLALGIGVAILLAFPLRRALIRRFGYIEVEAEPTYGQRLRTALFTGFIRTLLPSAAVLALFLSLAYTELLTEPLLAVARTALLSLVLLFFVAGFCRAALAPFEPEWRLVRIHDEGARAISRTVNGLAFVFALDRVLSEIGTQFNASVESTLLQKFLFGLLIAALLLYLLRRRIWFAAESPLSPTWQRLRYVLMLVVYAIPVTGLLGYVVLSRLLATQLVLTAGLYLSVLLLRKISSELIEDTLSKTSPVGARLRSSLALSDEGAEMLTFWLSGTVGLLILAMGLVLLLVLWGAAGKDLTAWLHTVFFGFKVGNITLSLADILLALVLFAGLLVVTRMLQKALDQRIFPRTRLDVGIRHSVRSGIGYIGFTIAAMLAISTLGIDLSNLAIIAGALSVGIGFGLQNIVNNFVSGLILLIERPIKAGDWVVVGDHQGHVKKISVRATEITTLDRASVYIPNSTLISGALTNRTYADKAVGRIVLPIGLSHDADAKRVRNLLLKIAFDHPEIHRNPPPIVLFKGFSESTRNFELIAVVHDAGKVDSVTSDLCFEIDDVFRKEGIPVPFPPRDFNLNLNGEQLQQILAVRGTSTVTDLKPDYSD
jgi:small-conductance mechanosensitive channel